MNGINLKIIKANSCIFYNKSDNGKLELVMPVHVDDVFMVDNPETLEKTKEKIKLKLNIQESGKLKNFLGVYYELGRDAKGSYTERIMEKDVKKLVEG